MQHYWESNRYKHILKCSSFPGNQNYFKNKWEVAQYFLYGTKHIWKASSTRSCISLFLLVVGMPLMPFMQARLLPSLSDMIHKTFTFLFLFNFYFCFMCAIDALLCKVLPSPSDMIQNTLSFIFFPLGFRISIDSSCPIYTIWSYVE